MSDDTVMDPNDLSDLVEVSTLDRSAIAKRDRIKDAEDAARRRALYERSNQGALDVDGFDDDEGVVDDELAAFARELGGYVPAADDEEAALEPMEFELLADEAVTEATRVAEGMSPIRRSDEVSDGAREELSEEIAHVEDAALAPKTSPDEVPEDSALYLDVERYSYPDRPLRAEAVNYFDTENLLAYLPTCVDRSEELDTAYVGWRETEAYPCADLEVAMTGRGGALNKIMEVSVAASKALSTGYDRVMAHSNRAQTPFPSAMSVFGAPLVKGRIVADVPASNHSKRPQAPTRSFQHAMRYTVARTRCVVNVPTTSPLRRDQEQFLREVVLTLYFREVLQQPDMLDDDVRMALEGVSLAAAYQDQAARAEISTPWKYSTYRRQVSAHALEVGLKVLAERAGHLGWLANAPTTLVFNKPRSTRYARGVEIEDLLGGVPFGLHELQDSIWPGDSLYAHLTRSSQRVARQVNAYRPGVLDVSGDAANIHSAVMWDVPGRKNMPDGYILEDNYFAVSAMFEELLLAVVSTPCYATLPEFNSDAAHLMDTKRAKELLFGDTPGLSDNCYIAYGTLPLTYEGEDGVVKGEAAPTLFSRGATVGRKERTSTYYKHHAALWDHERYRAAQSEWMATPRGWVTTSTQLKGASFFALLDMLRLANRGGFINVASTPIGEREEYSDLFEDTQLAVSGAFIFALTSLMATAVEIARGGDVPTAKMIYRRLRGSAVHPHIRKPGEGPADYLERMARADYNVLGMALSALLFVWGRNLRWAKVLVDIHASEDEQRRVVTEREDGDEVAFSWEDTDIHRLVMVPLLSMCWATLRVNNAPEHATLIKHFKHLGLKT